jgi:hypothetical protein
MAEKLTKGVLEGIDNIETVEGLKDRQGNEYEVDIRPLRYTQSMKIQAMVTADIDIGNAANGKKEDILQNIKFDTSKVLKNNMQANLEAAAWGTVDEYWTQKTIDKEWPPEWIEKVGQRVMEISNIDVDENDEEENTEGAE